jgi:hypothetical protein
VLDSVGEEYEQSLLDDDANFGDQIGFGDHKSYQRTAVSAESCGRWRKLPDAIVQKMATVANPTLEKCGYDRIETDDGGGVESARRRYALSLMMHKKRGEGDGDK